MSRSPWLSDDQQHVWRLFLQMTGMLSEHLDRQMRRDAGIPQTYYQALAMLSEAPGESLRMAELAAAAWVSPSRMSHAIARLEEAGWVERCPAAGDGRGQIARLTDSGRAMIRSAAPGHAAAVKEILFESLDPELLAAFGRICESALARLRASAD